MPVVVVQINSRGAKKKRAKNKQATQNTLSQTYQKKDNASRGRLRSDR